MNYSELTFAFLQINAICQPKVIGKGKNRIIEIDPKNIDNLCRFNFNEHLKETRVFVSSEFKVQRYWNFYKDEENGADPRGVNIKETIKIGIRGEGYHYIFEPEQTTDIWNRLKSMLPKCDTVKLEITEPANEFKELAYFEKTDLQHIKTAAKFTGEDQLRPNLECLLLQNNKVIGCDAHRLIKYDIDFENELMLTQDGQKFLRGCKKYVRILQDETRLRLETEGKSIVIDKYEGPDYPDYNAVIPQSFNYSIKVNRQKLIEAVRQAAASANQASNLIRLSVKDNRLTIIGQDIDFATSCIMELNCISDYRGAIGFKSTFLLDCLDANHNKKLSWHEMAGDEITIQINAPDKATFVDGILLMPMEIKDETINVEPAKKVEPKLENSFTDKKFNRGAILRNAWVLYRTGQFESWRDCMLHAWKKAKDDKMNYQVFQSNLSKAA
jgi:hypothetical protein